MLSSVGQGSDRFGELGERCDGPQFGADLDSEFVVAAAHVLQKGVAGDHYLRCPIGLQSAHRSQPALELAVIGLYPVVGYCSTWCRGNQLGGIDGSGVGNHLAGGTFSIRSALVKNRLAAAASRREDSSTSMTWPCWSTARYTYRQTPWTLT